MDNNDFDFRLQPGLSSKTIGKSNGDSPLLSIITPYYEAWIHFPQTFQSVLKQTFPYWEWIIVNDGSMENATKLKAIIQCDPRIRLLHQENKGPAAARNLALKHVKSELIVPLDADDLINETFLECAYWTMQTHPQASWSYTDTVGFGEQEYLWNVPFSCKKMKIQNDLVLTSCIRKEALESVGGFDKSAKYAFEDWQLWLELLVRGHRPLHMSWYGFWYRRSSIGVLSKVRRDSKAAKRVIRSIIKSITKDVQAIEFPRITENTTSSITYWQWNRQLFLPSDSRRILFILDSMQVVESNQFLLNLLTCFNGNSYHIGIMSTRPASNNLRQELEIKASEVFDLSSFLNMTDWAQFIHYYIRTRQVDMVVLSESVFGYYLLPWLRQQFLIPIIDLIQESDQGEQSRQLSTAMNAFLDKSYVGNQCHLDKIKEEWEALIEKKGDDDDQRQYMAKIMDSLGTFPLEMSLLYQQYSQLAMKPDVSKVRDRYYVELLKRIMNTSVFRFFLHVYRRLR